MNWIATLFIITLGCLGHFIFEWSGHRKWAGLLFAVNESVWEHIKLTILPSFLWLIFEICRNGLSCNLIIAHFFAMITMMALIPGLFYGYTAITHKNWLITDIICFIVAVVAGVFVHYLISVNGVDGGFLAGGCLAGLIAIGIAYLRLSYHAPHTALFKDPISGGYGPVGHECNSDFHTHNAGHHQHRH